MLFGADKQKAVAEKSDWKLCWLKDLAQEIAEESPGEDTERPPLTSGDASKLNVTMDIRDRLLIARLSLDPNGMATS